MANDTSLDEATTVWRVRAGWHYLAHMKNLFNQEEWSVAEAIVFICLGEFKGRPGLSLPALVAALERWSSTKRDFPSTHEADRGRAESFLEKLNSVVETDSSMSMNSGRWTWFALAKMRSQVNPKFRSAFEIWATSLLNDGMLPVVQRRRQGEKWQPIKLDGSTLTLEHGVPVVTAPYRAFKKDEAGDSWRLVLHPISVKRKQKARSHHQSGSPGCEAMLTKILSSMCRGKGAKVLRAGDGDGDPRPFYSATLKQPEVLKRVIKHGGKELTSMFADSTIRRSLRLVLKTERGAKRKDL